MTGGSETTEAIEGTVVGVVNVPDQWMRPRQPAGMSTIRPPWVGRAELPAELMVSPGGAKYKPGQT